MSFISLNLITASWLICLSHISYHSKSFLWSLYLWVGIHKSSDISEASSMWMLYRNPQFNMVKNELNTFPLNLLFLTEFFESCYYTINYRNTQQGTCKLFLIASLLNIKCTESYLIKIKTCLLSYYHCLVLVKNLSFDY